ncbi:hypothetical protein [Candidatus Binatus sp.]|jgi:hypothetical protein|uniref:hypothetical protein n=1 Tax=Candidatus Binatus sp. TaxID=2811406 RepID=UPI003BD899F9
MKLTLSIWPAEKVIGSMPQTDVKRTPVLLGLIARPDDGAVEFLIDVVFQSIRIQRPLGRGHWYVAATEAEIELRANGATIVAYTKAPAITIQYTVAKTKEKKVDVGVKPEIDIAKNVTVSIGGVGVKAAGSEEATIAFSDQESPLASVVRGDSIVWQQSMTRGEKAIRDFIFGDLHLSVKCKWKNQDRQGSVGLRTSPMFFDAKGRMLSKFKSLLIGFVLDTRSYLANEQGTDVQFACSEK